MYIIYRLDIYSVLSAWELMTKPRPLAVIRNRRLNSVAPLAPLRSVQFSALLQVYQMACGLNFRSLDSRSVLVGSPST